MINSRTSCFAKRYCCLISRSESDDHLAVVTVGTKLASWSTFSRRLSQTLEGSSAEWLPNIRRTGKPKPRIAKRAREDPVRLPRLSFSAETRERRDQCVRPGSPTGLHARQLAAGEGARPQRAPATPVAGGEGAEPTCTLPSDGASPPSPDGTPPCPSRGGNAGEWQERKLPQHKRREPPSQAVAICCSIVHRHSSPTILPPPRRP